MIEGVSSTTDTVPVRDVHRIDEAALERYLTEHVRGFRGPIELRQFQGGQSNPTYYMRAGSGEYVLLRKPPGKLLPSAHAVDREYRVITALQGSGVPVPRTYVLCEDPAVVGTSFYLMDCVHGRVFADPLLPGVSPADRRALYDQFAEILARLHRVDWKAIGLDDFGRPGNYFARQIHRWATQYRASETEKIDAMERLMVWLPENIPADDTVTLVHGDYRPGNMIVHPTEPRVLAVLDWELSTLGHALGDLSYTLCRTTWGPARRSAASTGSISSRWGFRARPSTSRRTARRRGAARSSTGTSTSHSRSSGWARSRKASWAACATAPPTTRARSSAASGRARWARRAGPSSNNRERDAERASKQTP